MDKKASSINDVLREHGERLSTIETLLTNHLAHQEATMQRVMWFIGILVPVGTLFLDFLIRKWVG